MDSTELFTFSCRLLRLRTVRVYFVGVTRAGQQTEHPRLKLL